MLAKVAVLVVLAVSAAQALIDSKAAQSAFLEVKGKSFNQTLPYCQQRITVSKQMKRLGAYDILAEFHALSDCSMCTEMVKGLEGEIPEDCAEKQEKLREYEAAYETARQKIGPG